MNSSSNPSLAIKVHKSKGQETIESLKIEGSYDKSRVVNVDGDYLWIPITKQIDGAEERELVQKNRSVSLNEKYNLSSFDIIGEIIILFLPAEADGQKKEIGKYLQKLYPNVRAIYRKKGAISGEYRTSNLELIAGKGEETIHIENGLLFKLNVTKVFFSPRQITERVKLTNYIRKGDKVCVFFSGIAPIPIYLSKFTSAEKIVGIELNPIAHKYGLENLKINHIQNVVLINDDINRIIPRLTPGELFDLIIMPTPKNKNDFLPMAIKGLKSNGRLIIYYISTKNSLKEKLDEIKELGLRIKEKSQVAQVSPKEWRYVIIAYKNPGI